jgi:hypothetical protein
MLTKREVEILGRALGRARPPSNAEYPAEVAERWQQLVTALRDGLTPTNRLGIFDSLIENPERPL